MATILTSINSPIQTPLTTREREMVHHLRVLLKDLPDDTIRSLGTLVEEQRGERWSDMQLLVYLNQAVSDINAEPAHTFYVLDNYPEEWKACVINGGMIFALIAEGILQNGRKIISSFYKKVSNLVI